MRVSIVTETYFPQVNGVSRTLGQLVRHLEARGDAVQVVQPDYGTAPEHRETYRARAVTLPFYRELHLPLPPFGGVCRAIEAFGPDLIHIATEATLGWSVLRHALVRKIPVVSSFHTNFDEYSAHYRLGFARGMIWRYLRWFHNRTRETYVPSRATLDALQTRGFERLVLWPRGVDGTLFRPDRPGRASVRAALGLGREDVVIAYVGRIAAEKNIGYLTDALEHVQQARLGVRLLFVGDGPARPEIERRLADHATFAGYRTGADLADHYAAADLFAFASLTETFGNVVLEALASGLPVVALRAGGVGEIVRSGETGTLIEPSAPPSVFADALLALTDDSAERRRRSIAARAFAVSQSWDEIMSTLRARYQHIIDEASARPLVTN